VKPQDGVANEVNVARHQRLDVPLGGIVPGWAMMMDPQLIPKSSRELMGVINRNDWPLVVLPRPGCDTGGLSWDREVKPIFEPILWIDDSMPID
jgi:hypothetical protein